jgi:phage-related tail fiber protein
MARPSTAAVRSLAGWKEPCVVATTANIDLATGGLLTIDAVTVESGNRVLVKNQTNASENGIYTAAEGEWYRAPDATSARNINKGVLVSVQSGTANEDNIYAFDTLDPDIGTDDIDILLMDFSGAVSGISDAPGDGDQYVREDNTWVALEYATVAEVRASTAGNKIVVAERIEGASAFVALVDGANIAVDWDATLNFSLTLNGDRTLDNPTNGQPGTWRSVVITQGAGGSHTLAFGNQYRFVGGNAPTLTTDAAAVDVLSILCVTASLFYVFVALDMSA